MVHTRFTGLLRTQQPVIDFNQVTEMLPGGPHFAETLAAIDRAAFTGLEGYFRVLAALGANGREHLAGPAATAGAIPLGFSGLPARLAPLGLVGVALGLEELLLGGGEGERVSAISTRELLILETQRMTSFLQLVG